MLTNFNLNGSFFIDGKLSSLLMYLASIESFFMTGYLCIVVEVIAPGGIVIKVEDFIMVSATCSLESLIPVIHVEVPLLQTNYINISWKPCKFRYDNNLLRCQLSKMSVCYDTSLLRCSLTQYAPQLHCTSYTAMISGTWRIPWISILLSTYWISWMNKFAQENLHFGTPYS